MSCNFFYYYTACKKEVSVVNNVLSVSKTVIENLDFKPRLADFDYRLLPNLLLVVTRLGFVMMAYYEVQITCISWAPQCSHLSM